MAAALAKCCARQVSQDSAWFVPDLNFGIVNPLVTRPPRGFGPRPDPADGRAKLIDLTQRGRGLMAHAGDRVGDTEQPWSALVGERNFAQMCRTMQRLLDELDPKGARG